MAGRVCMAGGACVAGGHAWQGGYAWQGGHVWREAWMTGGCTWQGASVAGGMHGMHTPQQILRDTVNERAVLILLDAAIYSNLFH